MKKIIPTRTTLPNNIKPNPLIKVPRTKLTPTGIGPIKTRYPYVPLNQPQPEFDLNILRPDAPIRNVDESGWNVSKFNFKLWFSILPAASIINLTGPDYFYNVSEWNKPELDTKHRMGERFVQLMDKHTGFYKKLEESILTNGILNPILLTKGGPKFKTIEQVNPIYHQNINQYFFCELIGGSRLWIAQKHNLLIPCIISDFTNYIGTKQLVTKKDVVDQFTNPPDKMLLTDKGLKISAPEHTHLDTKDRDPNKLIQLRTKILHEELKYD